MTRPVAIAPVETIVSSAMQILVVDRNGGRLSEVTALKTSTVHPERMGLRVYAGHVKDVM